MFPLAQRLERLGVGFAVYSDDSLIWSDSYDQVSRAVEILDESAQDMGVSVNLSKSPGVSLLGSLGGRSELTSGIDSVSFIGYKIGWLERF